MRKLEFEHNGKIYTALYNYDDAINLNALMIPQINLQTLTEPTLAEDLIKDMILNQNKDEIY